MHNETIKFIKWLNLCQENVFVYYDSLVRHINTLCVSREVSLNNKDCSTCSYHWILNTELIISMFHRAFFNSIIDKHQHMHFFTFKTVLAQNVNFNVKIHKNI